VIIVATMVSPPPTDDPSELAEATWGIVEAGALDHLVVVSPHFDDAVLGAAHVLSSYPGTTVITVLGGRPPAYPPEPSPWDAEGGFHAGDDVVAVRRQEDRAALGVLSAEPVWLEFPDHQYLAKSERPRPAQVAPVLAQAIAELAPSAVFLPMGLANPDHVLTHDAGLLARDQLATDERGRTIKAWFCYEEHGYKHIPGLLAWRVATLLKSGRWPTPAIVPVDPDMPAKRRAIACYTSQIPPLQREHALSERLAANVPEQYWRLEPPPQGWEPLASSI
jgi:LmbE family N-acetylglucosaminyl deacetylase